MDGKTRLGRSSSLLVSVGGLLVQGLGLVLSLYFGSGLMAGLFLFFLLLSLLTRQWGLRAIRKVELKLSCTKTRLFPGQTTTLCYQVENKKLLPLAWLELAQNGPERDCLVPEEGFEAFRLPEQTEEEPPSLRQSFSFVGSYQTLRLDTQWTARRRGLYPITRLTARTGDGFGLVQQEHPIAPEHRPTLAVYPRQVEVDLAPFLSPQWDCTTGQRGWTEDNTVLRGNREYQPGDNWKHINWRMTAREQGVPVNLYEYIRPGELRFLLDGESFCGHEDELEQALEILASVLIGLEEAQLACSLTLPRSRRYAAKTVTGLEECLLHLAGYDLLALKEEQRLLPSHFPAGAIPQRGHLYLITYRGDCLPDALLPRLEPGRCTVLCRTEQDAPARLGLRSYALQGLRRGGEVK